jgi:divalent metal cation (Fe/Co/Zn/Cd) transporter
MAALIDETDNESLDALSNVIKTYRKPMIIDIHHLRAIRSGSFHHIDAHVVVPEFLNIAEVHDEIQAFEKKVVRDYPFDGEIAFHMDPCKQDFCGKCEVANCSIRKRPFKELYSFSVSDMIKGPQKC